MISRSFPLALFRERERGMSFLVLSQESSVSEQVTPVVVEGKETTRWPYPADPEESEPFIPVKLLSLE